MSAHVVVIDSTARRATVKTTPGKHLADILQEACAKLGLDASQNGLKHKSKQLDLSLPFRLSGLSSGAKLELVQLSRSPSIVTVALQLPESEAQGVPNGRLLDKFPSTTTLWLVLRKFEAGVAGNGSTRNLTARGVPVTGNGDTGSGRLFYEIPVVNAMGRELSSFTDLQKSLAQLGFNSGNILLRLSFRRTDEPLEEAMVKIEEYFNSFGDAISVSAKDPASALAPGPTQEAAAAAEDVQPTNAPSAEIPQAPVEPIQTIESAPTTTSAPPVEPSVIPSVSPRPVTVFSPPSGTTPQSAQTTYDENDYVPTIDHAQAHQRRLNELSRNKRLPTDAEIAAKAAAEQEKLASIKEVDVKVRFPDQSQVVAKFGQHDTGKALYDFVRSCVVEPFTAEKFVITFFPSAGAAAGLGGKKIQNVVPDTDTALLIRDLGMAGRVLVNFSWDDKASPAARHSKTNILRPELRSKAQELKVQQAPDSMDVSEENVKSRLGRSLGAVIGDKGDQDKSGPRKVPKWLKLPGKK